MKTAAIILYVIAFILLVITILYARKIKLKKVWREYKGILDVAYEDRKEKRKSGYNIYVKGVPLKKKKIISEEEREIFRQVEQKKAEKQRQQEKELRQKENPQSNQVIKLQTPEVKVNPSQGKPAEKNPSEKKKESQMPVPKQTVPEKTEVLKQQSVALDKTEVLLQVSEPLNIGTQPALEKKPEGLYDRTEVLGKALDRTEVIKPQESEKENSTYKKEKGFTEVLSKKNL